MPEQNAAPILSRYDELTPFTITWRDARYRVSIPEYSGGEVYRAEDVRDLIAERDAAENHRVALMTMLGVQGGSIYDAALVINGKLAEVVRLTKDRDAVMAERDGLRRHLKRETAATTAADESQTVELSALRAELAHVKAERDRQYEFNAGQIAKYAALEADHAESVTALCFVRSRLIGLRHEACNDELHELSEELTGILSFIDAAISATTAQPEATCKDSLQVQPPVVAESATTQTAQPEEKGTSQ